MHAFLHFTPPPFMRQPYGFVTGARAEGQKAEEGRKAADNVTGVHRSGRYRATVSCVSGSAVTHPLVNQSISAIVPKASTNDTHLAPGTILLSAPLDIESGPRNFDRIARVQRKSSGGLKKASDPADSAASKASKHGIRLLHLPIRSYS